MTPAAFEPQLDRGMKLHALRVPLHSSSRVSDEHGQLSLSTSDGLCRTSQLAIGDKDAGSLNGKQFAVDPRLAPKRGSKTPSDTRRVRPGRSREYTRLVRLSSRHSMDVFRCRAANWPRTPSTDPPLVRSLLASEHPFAAHDACSGCGLPHVIGVVVCASLEWFRLICLSMTLIRVLASRSFGCREFAVTSCRDRRRLGAHSAAVSEQP